MGQLFEIRVSGVASSLYPADTLYGLLWYGRDKALEIPKRYPYKGEWGQCLSDCILLKESYPMPYKLNIVWLSIVERKFYALEEMFPKMGMEQEWKNASTESGFLYTHIVVGMAPYGYIALWFHGEKKSKLLAWMEGLEAEMDFHVFAEGSSYSTLDELCNYYINSDPLVKKNLEQHGLPPRDLFDNYMKQFMYRYQVEFGLWEEEHQKWKPYSEEEKEQKLELDFIEEALYDGTHDKLHDGGLMRYHVAGKPKKLAVQWHKGKKEWTAYFWFEDEEIRSVFDRFYGAHPENKADLMLRIDPEKNHYELALFRYGLPEPRVISERAYQLLVFKNKFECFRSDNYDQESGAWIW